MSWDRRDGKVEALTETQSKGKSKSDSAGKDRLGKDLRESMCEERQGLTLDFDVRATYKVDVGYTARE